MKVKFNRNVKHNGVFYERDHVYEIEEGDTTGIESLFELTHEDVFTQKNTSEVEQRVEVNVAEAAPADAVAEPQPAPLPKTAPINKTA